MADTNTTSRSLHDLGLAAWFGGGLMGAVGLNGAAAKADSTDERLRLASTGWARWSPVNLAAISAHLVGATALLGANRGRLAGQKGVATMSIAKTALTAGALGATAWSGVLGKKVAAADGVPAAGATEPSQSTPPDVAKAQRQLEVAQWLIPALTGALVVVNALMGEQQRPASVAQGVAQRLLPS
jgi:hypothetical protein